MPQLLDRSFAARFLPGVAALALLGACTVGAVVDGHGDDAPSMRLVGPELEDALRGDRVLIAPAAYTRLALAWDGSTPEGLELQMRAAGAWSRWHTPILRHSEIEKGAAFHAEVTTDGRLADAVRLRGPAGVALDLRIEFLGEDADELEDGAAPERVGAQFRAPLGVPVITRAAWGAKAPRCASPGHTPRKITLHHTDTPNADTVSVEARVRGIQTHHTGTRKWCDIGYHFLIAPDGRIFEGRPVDQVGSHTKSNNTGNIGIALIGTFNTRGPAPAQREAAARLIAALGDAYGLSLNATTVKGHRDYMSTDCPGDKTYADLAALIDDASTGGGGPVEIPPPADEVAVRGVVYRAGTSERLSGAQVTLNPGGRTMTTGSSGDYEFAGLSAGTYTIRAEAGGYLQESITRELRETETWASMGLSKLGAGGDAGLQGVVYTDGDGSNRVPGATVEIDGGPTLVADGAGYYRVDGLAAGTYTVRASATGVGGGVTVRTAYNGEATWASVELTAGGGGGGNGGGAGGGGGATCGGHCGEATPAPGSAPECYCDAGCEDYGDCCGDYAQACGAAPPPRAAPTCAESCGDTAAVPGSSPACYCDGDCVGYGDCCPDYAATCE